MDALIIAQLSGKTHLQEWPNLERIPTLIDGGGADTGGPNALPHGLSTWTPATATAPASLTFKPKVRPKGEPWDNVYDYQKLPQGAPCTYFSLSFQFALPTPADIAAATAVEWEIELCESGLTYNMAWQCFVAGKQWRLFNQAVTPKRWDTIPGLPAPTNQPNAIAFFSVDRKAKTVTHEGLSLDGQLYSVGLTHSALPKWSPSTNYLHHALQLDSNGKGTPFGVKVLSWGVREL